MNEYIVKRIQHSNYSFPLADEVWRIAQVASVDFFLPESSTHHPSTKVRLLYDSMGIYGLFRVQDRYVRCLQMHHQQAVYEDACVEFFIQPAGAKGYFNFEFNACGTMFASYVLNPQKDKQGVLKDFILLRRREVEFVKTRSTIKAPIAKEIKSELDWELEFFIPLELLNHYASPKAKPEKEGWRVNFYKCAENNSHPHWAAWAPLPELNFHLPQYFGILKFEA